MFNWNSSSFIREGSFLGIPAVIIGDRQYGREHAKNVIFSNYSRNEILKKLKIRLERNTVLKYLEMDRLEKRLLII